MIKQRTFTRSNMSKSQIVACCACIAALLILLMPNLAFGSGGSGASSGAGISTVLCNVVNALQGTIGKAIATIAIIVLGIGLFAGKLSWPLAVATAIGIGMIFGASEIVAWVSTGTGGGAASCS